MFVCVAIGCGGKDGAGTSDPPAEDPSVNLAEIVDIDEMIKSQAIPESVDLVSLGPQVRTFCGDCHAYPEPDTFARESWPAEVAQGYKFYEESGRGDLYAPPRNEVIAYYMQQAPERLRLTKVSQQSEPPKIAFSPIDTSDENGSSSMTRGVSHLNLLSLDKSGEGGKNRDLFACDMMTGDVLRFDTKRLSAPTATVVNLIAPAHSEAADLDADGLMDLIVADLGAAVPMDGLVGRVVWVRQRAANEFEPIVLQEKIGRVADVRAADFDGDGDLDLVVAEFGWRRVGRILMLTNEGFEDGAPQFSLSVVDERHGAIHVPAVDLNGDDKMDFVALISQEHETIVAFLNQGDGKFSQQIIFVSDNPAYGSSGMQLADMDSDGDLDVLYSNGDSFDSYELKPYHGIQWLENDGRFPYQLHRVADMPGVHRALAGDLDGDGDMDIAAASMLPANTLRELEPGMVDSVIWLEQIDGGQFARRAVQADRCNYASLELADLDHDGDLDIVTGSFRKTASESMPFLNVWLNSPSKSGGE